VTLRAPSTMQPEPRTAPPARTSGQLPLGQARLLRDYGPQAFREVAVMPFGPLTTLWPAVVRLLA
jgi:hypothetical protein